MRKEMNFSSETYQNRCHQHPTWTTQCTSMQGLMVFGLVAFGLIDDRVVGWSWFVRWCSVDGMQDSKDASFLVPNVNAVFRSPKRDEALLPWFSHGPWAAGM